MSDVQGFDDAIGKLRDLGKRARELDGEQEVPVTDLLTGEFMERNSAFSSFDQMIDDSPWSVESQEDFESIPDDEWDQFVDEHTRFSTWEEMLQSAGEEWAVRKLDLN